MAWLLVCVWAHERVSAAWLLVFPTPSHFFAAHSAIPRCLYRGDPSASAPCLLIYQSINQSINQSNQSPEDARDVVEALQDLDAHVGERLLNEAHEERLRLLVR